MIDRPSRRKVGRLFSTLLFALASGMVGAGAANALTIGTNDGSTFIPFGGLTSELADTLTENFPGDPNFDPTLIPRSQQVYSAGEFSGPMAIQEIRFFQFDPPGLPGSALLGGTFTITLSTTSASVNGLACCDAAGFDSNLGIDATVFAADVDISTIFSGGVLAFTGDAFLYDPSMGNLLIDIQITGYDPFNAVAELVLGLETFFQLTNDTDGLGDPITSVVDNFDGLDNSGVGLVTLFLVPEPSSFLLLSGGLIGLGLLRKRRAGTC